MPARIGLLGGECTGKSALASALATDLPACVVPEQLRQFVRREGRAPRADEQHAVMRAQQRAEREALGTCDRRVVVGDPAPLMTAVYSLAYFEDDSLVDEAVADAVDCDLLVWCGTGLPWQPDPGQRTGPQQRSIEHGIIGRIVAERLLPAGGRVLEVDGPTTARAAAVRRAWQTRASRKPT